MAKIIDLVRKKKAEIEANPDVATKNSLLAIAGITGGITSDAWQKYMEQFVDKGSDLEPKQIARLLAKDKTADDPELRMKRAYMLSNAVCGPESPMTTGEFDYDVETIDHTLPDPCP